MCPTIEHPAPSKSPPAIHTLSPKNETHTQKSTPQCFTQKNMYWYQVKNYTTEQAARQGNKATQHKALSSRMGKRTPRDKARQGDWTNEIGPISGQARKKGQTRKPQKTAHGWRRVNRIKKKKTRACKNKNKQRLLCRACAQNLFYQVPGIYIHMIYICIYV